MSKINRSKRKKQHKSEKLTELNSSPKDSQRTPLWQAVLLPVAAIIIFFLLLEGFLLLFGLKPALQDEDPFVGFASNVPLFVHSKGPEDGQIMITAPNRMKYFNKQEFSRIKAPGTYRIFCLGGSTTYGRPYDDSTSFSEWLRELLPSVDMGKRWEVINAGGISYASYRVTHLMDELINYQPDLFIIYTGHNEFLEERTYKQIREIPVEVKRVASLLARTRTWSAMKTSLQKLGISPRSSKEKPSRLAAEVNSLLDKSIGTESYTRDDLLKKNILEHYRLSLERMVEMARSVNAQVIFVTPASNLKDCSPFKSEYSSGLEPVARQQVKVLLTRATKEFQQKNLPAALQLVESAARLNPRHASLEYLRGKLLLDLKRFNEAEIALRLARDEDIVPLRALTPMRQTVIQVAEEQKVDVVDYVELLKRRMLQIKGHDIPGREFFLDHVHPTIGGHKILAVALINKMIEKDMVQPKAKLNNDMIAAVDKKIRGRIDAGRHGYALANLARVFSWAGKTNDAERLASQAIEVAGDDGPVVINATSILVTASLKKGKPQRALTQIYSAIEMFPDAIKRRLTGAIDLRLKLGEILLGAPFHELEKAAANFLLVSMYMPDDDFIHDLFGTVMAMRNRPRIAYPSLKQALSLNPDNSHAQKTIEDLRPILKEENLNKTPADIVLDTYASSTPRRLVQIRHDNNGNQFPDGIEVEFYENGRLKSFLDVKRGKPHGLQIKWDKDGQILSRVVYRQGVPVNNDKGT
ncbi:tetratricopeptide repeat protein [Thermodesulfobacteriota bacterium]